MLDELWYSSFSILAFYKLSILKCFRLTGLQQPHNSIYLFICVYKYHSQWKLYAPSPHPPTQGFIAGHDNTFCGKPFGQHRSPPKIYNLLSVRAGEAQRAKSLTIQPRKTQNLSNLWASTKGNYLQPGWAATDVSAAASLRMILDSQTSNSFQHSEHKPTASKSIPSLEKRGNSRWCPQDLMITSTTKWRIWMWNFTKTFHGTGSPLTIKMPPWMLLSKGLERLI